MVQRISMVFWFSLVCSMHHPPWTSVTGDAKGPATLPVLPWGNSAKLRSACGSDSHWRKRVALCILMLPSQKNIQKTLCADVCLWLERKWGWGHLYDRGLLQFCFCGWHPWCVPNDFGCVVSVHSRKQYVRVTNATQQSRSNEPQAFSSWSVCTQCVPVAERCIDKKAHLIILKLNFDTSRRMCWRP